ncbi:DUF4041 domain-containing protein [Porcipelethomonas ammoniilytica]|uniref:DUF4041 domain-containing protein n=1 Tax=Porcipelethomonas ammoniilytica TaxID=2981722 RepID=UPI000820FB0A|nr:DUF4041 domain-containing protein [Porcipelethomonas ammoniilytica]MCU6720699.1 DUF4041 domain-containing protein [Porcipelethomonas ammoniilytica]SCJ22151.1 Uncharacterized protein conserved in bacteria with the myosin-like domain [uncultured Ruminococcus sp.]
MGLKDIIRCKETIKENEELKEKVKELESLIMPEHKQISDLNDRIKLLTEKSGDLQETISLRENKVAELQNTLDQLNEQIVETNETVLLQSYGIYEPTYDFATSDEYKDALKSIREEGKAIIKNDISSHLYNNSWTVNGDASKGKKMVNDMSKLLTRAFNSECDELISKVKYNNYDTFIKRIEKSFNAINKLGKVLGVSITEVYKNNRIRELTLAYEYAQKKQQEKEEQREIKAKMREEAKLQKEIEEARKKLEKEQTHYLNALAKINHQLSGASESEKEELISKKLELEEKIEDTEKAIKDVDYREANKRAGYVYIISNIGAFGENVYKIGMTRRLDPMERVYELGDASVPFNFDVHAMIFSDDAPKLENALHKAFEDRKLNMVNQRREFFNVTLDEIKKVVKENYDKTVEFIDLPEAEQYRVSEKMRKDTVHV